CKSAIADSTSCRISEKSCIACVIDETVIAATIKALVAAWEDPEAAEGIGAFFDKRPPGWAQG
ncbi:MAG: hypothetical protein AAFQ05_06430, partial [Pseudomonadota bacterium]